MTELAISARGIGKRYKRNMRARKHDSVRDLIASGVQDMFASKAQRAEKAAREEFWALRDASFDIKKGENVGIIGLNGAGKSTLLKLLSRIATPTTGEITIRGRLGALLEVGTGFHQELTGRENTYLYGSILGMTRAEVNEKFDAIVEFSEIGEFIDTPVKRYSSGMYVRLAFAVAAHLDPEILLLDEVLAVGDFAFQRKCMNFARQLEQKGSTILFVSHNMFSIKTMCERVIYLKKGQVVFDGPTDEGLKLYESDSKLQSSPWFGDASKNPPIVITDVEMLNDMGRAAGVMDHGKPMTVRVRYKAYKRIEQPDFRIGVTRVDEVHCCTFSTAADGIDIPFVEGEGTIEMRTPALNLVADLYNTSILVRDRNARILNAQVGGSFHVRHPVFTSNAFGAFHQTAEWRLQADIPTQPLEAADEQR
ncbi:MAG: ABC transporter ATP-binding protein [Terricaulis sp.]